jgi:glycosyltransferase involved in cell wall biosynthesis
MGYPALAIFAKFADIKCVVELAGFGTAARIQPYKESGDLQQFGELARLRISAILERLSLYVSDQLIVYDESIIDQAKLYKFSKKIVVAHRHFLNFDEYRLITNIEQRDNIVTYIGRLHEEKGVMNLVKAIPQVLSQRDDVQFLIIGDGELEDNIRSYIERYSLQGNVTLAGWIPHEGLPDYFAKSKLLVLPSYTEVLPHVLLEAMACGTPVLATAVGAVPRVIIDRSTGFLMHDNSPNCLAENILEALAYPNLKHVVSNARNYVQREFRYEKTLEMWANIISGDTKDK